MRTTSVILFLLFSSSAFCQKQANNWYFGAYAGITFNNGKPQALTNGQMSTIEGCATISTPSGRLLFYTDGIKVWDSTHTVMSNGSGLKGYPSSTQSGIIVPKPGSSTLFYVFTTDAQENACVNGLQYSEVDMTLNSGKGDVTSTKNVKLLGTTSEKITAVRKTASNDFWVLTFKGGKDTIYAYSVTSAGVNSTPVTSNLGRVVTTSNLWGYMKASPDGRFIAMANASDSVLFSSFDAKTGKVSKTFALNSKGAYGIEFSATGKYLYVNEYLNSRIVQYDLQSGSKSTINASRTVITSGGQLTALQIGPDQKIYSAVLSGSALGCIYAPDSSGSSCRYTANVVPLSGKTCQYGLPTFIQSYFLKNGFDYTRTCINDTTFFTISNLDGLDSVKWDFGDPSSGSKNISAKTKDIFHSYAKTGAYRVQLISHFKTNKDTSVRYVYITNSKPFLGNDTVLCGADAIFQYVVQPQKNYVTYLWHTGAKTKSIITNSGGTFIVNTSDTTGCKSADTIVITNPRNTAAFTLDQPAHCATAPFKITYGGKFVNDSKGTAIFYFSDGSTATDSLIDKKFPGADSAKIKLVIRGKSGCKDSLTRTVYIYPQAKPAFTASPDSQCLRSNRFSFNNTSSVNKGSISHYEWLFGDGKTDTLKHITGKNYTTEGNYIVRLITTTDKGCMDTVSRPVTVWPQPRASFTVNKAQQCFRGNNFTFTNTSSISKGSIQSNAWQTGDGNVFNSKNINSHIYGSEDSFSVNLVVNSDKGCADTLKRTVTVWPQPKASFSIPADSQCLKHNYVFIINQTVIKYGNLIHTWDFGDGNNSSQAIPPSKPYAAAGNYKIRYVAVSDHQCKDSANHAVSILPDPVTSFTVNDSIQCVLGHSFDFDSKSSWNYGTVSRKWQFDDGSVYTTTKITGKTFATAGFHYITFSTDTRLNCRDTSKLRLYLETPGSTGITVSANDSQCLRANDFNYTAQNLNPNVKIVLHDWNYGDGTAHDNAAKGKHSYATQGNYTSELISTSENGCHDTAYITITVMPHPRSDFSNSETCFPDPVQFTDKSVISSGNIIAWKWLFSDGTGSKLNNPVKSFGSTGSYNASLVTISDFGCTDTLKNRPVLMKPKPSARFTYERLEPDNPGDIKLQFSNQSAGSIIAHEWDFGDGNQSNDPNPFNTYKDTGSYRIRLVVKADNGCTDTFRLKTPKLFPEFFFFLPSAFSPNTDKLNEVFTPVASKFIQTYTMEIYNRWGEKIFESHDIGNGWDGTYKGTLCPDGAYLCRVQLMPVNGRIQYHEQMVMLLR